MIVCRSGGSDGYQPVVTHRALFDQAAELEQDARAAFLDAACRNDAGDVRAEVESLLASDAHHGETTAIAKAAPDLIEAFGEREAERWHAALVGTRLGVWRLLREIGRGGMGAVFLAERDDAVYHDRVIATTAAAD